MFWWFIGEVWQGKVHNLPGCQAFCSWWPECEGHRWLCGDQGEAWRKTGFYFNRYELCFLFLTIANVKRHNYNIGCPWDSWISQSHIHFSYWPNIRSNISRLTDSEWLKKVLLKSLVYKLQSLVENKFKYGKTEEFQTQNDLLTVQYRLFPFL